MAVSRRVVSRTSGWRSRVLLGVGLAVFGLPATAGAVSVWVNQTGYDPGAPKLARVVDARDVSAQPGTFVVVDAAGTVVTSGALQYVGAVWRQYFWTADFSGVIAAGTYQVRATLGGQTAASDPFPITADSAFAATAELAVTFFAVQRCGVAVPGWHAACHTDDGQLPNGVRRDVTGGWHDAGDYNKFTGFFLPHAFYALVYAFEERREELAAFDARTPTGFVPNGVPDIVDEAVFGADFLVKMVQPDGHLPMGVRLNRSGASFVTPEADSDRVVGTSDDRLIFEEAWSNGQAGLAIAGLAALYRVLEDDPTLLPARPEYLQAAEAMWDYYWSLDGGGQLSGSDLSQVLAALELYRATGSAVFGDYLALRAHQLGDDCLANPAIYDADSMTAGAHSAILLHALEVFPDLDDDGSIRSGALACLDRMAERSDNPAGIPRVLFNGELIYFLPYDLSGALGQNSAYASIAWAANLAYRATGEAKYRALGQTLLDWILGANPSRVCMVEGAGTRNLPGYHTRLYKIAGHTDGKVPGAVPNGYARDPENRAFDEPWIDLEPNSHSLLFGHLASYEANEPWLPNSGYYLAAIATEPHSPRPPVLDDGGPGADGGLALDGGAVGDGGGDADVRDSGPGRPDGGDLGRLGGDIGVVGPPGGVEPAEIIGTGCTALGSPPALAWAWAALVAGSACRRRARRAHRQGEDS